MLQDTIITTMSTAFYIITDGFVYAGTRRRVDIDDAITLLSKLLNGKPKAATFNVLSQGINVKWTRQDDIVNPFGDNRQAGLTMYTFNLDSDVLLFLDSTRTLQIPLSRFREDSSVALTEFTLFKPPSPLGLRSLRFQSPLWTPSSPLPCRSLPFVTRVLSDFAHQWRHILRHPYSDSTFRKLARAILCISTLDFKVVEIASRWMHTSERGPYVWIHHLPSWQACEEHLIRLGHITVVLDQDLERAMELVRNDATESNEQNKATTLTGSQRNNCFNVYILLSVRHIALCRINDQGVLLCTPPAAFLNGVDAPSSTAIALLLRGLRFAFPQPHTWIHDLPIEIQDRILKHVSEGAIEAARLGSLLELGSPFGWMRTKDELRKGGAIARLESPTHRSGTTPVESQVWFEVFSGVAYR
ncbi:hypothetical protein F5884DRAFT_535917 [Xylogone sp. PMI_703]|nr:hypothetical protein F5884DRAFT_535917 [Xylogone sp. PMI_703]